MAPRSLVYPVSPVFTVSPVCLIYGCEVDWEDRVDWVDWVDILYCACGAGLVSVWNATTAATITAAMTSGELVG